MEGGQKEKSGIIENMRKGENRKKGGGKEERMREEVRRKVEK